MIYLGLLPESLRVLAKKQETVSEMFERLGSVPVLIHRFPEMGMGSSGMIGTICCHYQLRVRELTRNVWPFC